MEMNKHLSRIMLNANVLNAPIKRHRVAEWIRRPTYMLSTRDLPQNKIFTQAESEGMGKIFHANRHGKKKLGSNSYIRQNRLQNQGHNKRQGRSLLHS